MTPRQRLRFLRWFARNDLYEPNARRITRVEVRSIALVTALSRYVSLGSILGAIAACVLAYLFGHVEAAGLYLVLTLVIVAKHTGNIRRLFAGTESKFGARG